MVTNAARQENAPNFGILDVLVRLTNVVSMAPVKMVINAMTDAVRKSGCTSADNMNFYYFNPKLLNFANVCALINNFYYD